MAVTVGRETCCHTVRPQRGTRELLCSEETLLALQERPCVCLARGLVHPPSSKDFPKCVLSVSSALSDLKWQVKTCWASLCGHITGLPVYVWRCIQEAGLGQMVPLGNSKCY